MIWKEHSDLKGKHAFLGASSPYWLNDNNDEIIERYAHSYSQAIGTLLHEYACNRIKFGIKLYKTDKHDMIFYLLDHGIPENIVYFFNMSDIFETLLNYVNDGIGFRMRTEQILYYSKNSFGTADCISFRDDILRIHDLKTGSSPVKIEQLLVYAALFCLEYGYNPEAINFELRIYQNQEVNIIIPKPEEINDIVIRIQNGDKSLNKFIEGV